MNYSRNRVHSRIMLHVLFLILLLLGYGTVSYAEGPSPSSSQIADRPRMVVGDSWVYEVEGTRYVEADVRKSTVVKVEADGSFTIESVSEKGKKYTSYYNDKSHLVKRVQEKPKHEEQTFDPPRGLNFPLFVGKKWSSSTWGQSVGRYKYDYEFDHEVTALEPIHTKAGLFESYKIRQTTYIDNRKSFSIKTMWYAPSLKSTIKVKPDPMRSGGLGEEELVSYNLEGDEKKPIEGRLEELKKLKDGGLITEQDYEKKKREILDGL